MTVAELIQKLEKCCDMDSNVYIRSGLTEEPVEIVLCEGDQVFIENWVADL